MQSTRLERLERRTHLTAAPADLTPVLGGYDAPVALSSDARVLASIFQDQDGDGLRDAGEDLFGISPIAIDLAQYPLRQPDGSFEAVVSAGTHLLMLDTYYGQRYSITTGPLPESFTIAEGETLDLGNIGLRLNPTQALGKVYVDANRTRWYEPEDALGSGRTVFLDLDSDQRADAGEPQAVVDAAGGYVLALEPGQHGILRVAILDGEESRPLDNPISAIKAEAGITYSFDFFVLPLGNVSDSPTTDFNADGHPDLIISDPATAQPQIWFLRLGTRLGKADLTPPGTGWSIGGAGDFTGDGKPDLLWHNDTTGQSQIVAMDHTTPGAATDVPAVHPAWRVSGVGDFNADGKMDIVYHRPTTGHASVWLMDGTAFTSYHGLAWVSNLNWKISAVADMDNDGQGDLLWWNKSQRLMSRWLMNGRSVASFKGLPAAAPHVGDFLALMHANQDGILDQLWAVNPWAADPDEFNRWNLVIWTMTEATPAWPLFSRLRVPIDWRPEI